MNIYLKILCGGLVVFLLFCLIVNPFSMPSDICINLLLIMALKIGLFIVLPLLIITLIIKSIKKSITKTHENKI